MKKVLSLVLVIAMVLSSMSFAFAGTFSDTADSDYEKAIEVLAALGVISGYPDGTFGAERTITRAELAKILVEALGYGELVAGASSAFPDTANHWAKGYVAIAAGTGLVLGYPDGTFRPENPVTFDETYTMVIRALGYTDSVLSGTWPTNYKVKAIDLDLNDDVVMVKAQADRGAVAQIFYNTLMEYMVEIDEDGIAVRTADEKQFIDNIATYNDDFDVDTTTVDPDHKNYASEIVDLTPYMYQNLDVYMNEDDQVVYVKGTNNLVVEGVLNDANDATSTTLTIEDPSDIETDDAKDDFYDITTSSAFMVNGVETDLANLQYVDSNVKVTVVLDAKNNDKLVDGLDVVGIVAEKATDEVQVTTEYKAGRIRFSGINLPLDSDDEVDLTKVTLVGVDSLEDIAEDSIVTLYEGFNANDVLKQIKLVVGTDTVEGKISKMAYDQSTVTIDGTSYDASDFADYTDIAVGNSGILYLNANGEFFKLGDAEGAAENYAVTIGSTAGDYVDLLEDYEKYPKIKLATADDEKVVYEVADEADIFGVVIDTEAEVDNFTLTAAQTGAVVTYELDEDGRIESMELAPVLVDRVFTTDSKAFILADNAVIFDGTVTAGSDAYQVLDVSQLSDADNGVTADVIYNDNDEIELLFVTVGAEAIADGTYAIINNVEETLNNDGKAVYLITAYVDGVKVSYLTNRTFYTSNPDASALRTDLRGGYKLNEFTMDGDIITAVATESAIAADANVDFVSGNVKTVKADNDVITLVGGTVVVLEDDAVVYLQTGTATVEVTDIYDIDADSDATTTSTQGDTIKALDTDNDGEFDIVVIKQR